MTTAAVARRDDLIAALPWAVLGAALFALVFALPKFAEGSAHPLQAGWVRYAGGAGIMLTLFVFRAWSDGRPAARAAGREPAFPRRLGTYLPWHVARAVCGVGTVVCGVFAVTQIPIATAMSISQTNGAFILLFAAVFLRERVSPRVAGAGLLALLGGLVVAEPDFGDLSSFLSPGAAVAFLGAVFWALEVILLKYTADRDKPMAILLLVNISAFLLLSLPVVWFWRTLPAEFLVLYAAMGPLAIAGQFCNIRALQLANASSVTPVKYATLVFSALIGIAFFGELPTWSLLIGAAMIVTGGWIATRATNIPRRIG